MPDARPLLSASMIVRNEEASIGACLRSLAGHVDEVVIYDTGSTDATGEVATAVAGEMGISLVLVEGYWDDDFSRARNASLEHCRGEWILIVDADETVVCEDPGRLRSRLARSRNTHEGGSPVDAFGIEVVNVDGERPESSNSFNSTRLFRRERCHWSGPLHEQVVTDDDRMPYLVDISDIRIAHWGYATGTVVARSKLERNLRIAQSALERASTGPERCRATVDCARTLVAMGRHRDAIALFEDVVADPSASAREVRRSRQGIASLSLDLGEPDRASREVPGLWRACDLPALPAHLEARVLARVGPSPALHRAARRLATLPPDLPDDDGIPFGVGLVTPVLLDAYEELDLNVDAANVVLESVAAGCLPANLDVLVGILARAGRSPSDLAGALAPWLVEAVLGQLGELEAQEREELRSSLAERWPDDPRLASIVADQSISASATGSAPLLSASMIVRNEEAGIGACLRSLAGQVDEVVLYDTGSTDATGEVATSVAGEVGISLVLVQGYWDDDFSRARNVSLEHCRGEWILIVDADESWDSDDPGELRALLATAGEIDAFAVPVVNTAISPGSVFGSFASVRLFRRDRHRWVGLIHEQVKTLDGSPPLSMLLPDGARVVHRGYASGAGEESARAQRNLKIAEAEYAKLAEAPSPSHVLVNYGRALWGAGRADEALDALARGLEEPDITPIERRYALEATVHLGIACTRFDMARSALQELWRECDSPVLPLYLSALLELRSGQDLARVIDRVAVMLPGCADDGGSLFVPARTAPVAVEALSRLGRTDEAAVAVLDAVDAGVLCVQGKELLDILDRSGRPVDQVVERSAPWLLKPLLAEAVRIGPPFGHRILDAMGRRWPDEQAIQAIARHLDSLEPVQPAPPDRNRQGGGPA